MAPLDGKIAIITGASAPNGIGRAAALRLAQDGAAVVVTDIGGSLHIDGATMDKQELLEELVGDIRSAGGQAMSAKVDVTSRADIDACVEVTSKMFGTANILVNNAATLLGTGAFMESNAEDWTTSFNINLLGVMQFSQAVITGMKKIGWGSIVNIGSTGSLGAEPGFGAYTTMKHGLVGLTKTIAAELGPDGIRCNVVCPGYTNTDMHMAVNERLAREQDLPIEEVKAQRYKHVALRRAGAPEEVAQAISYLAGPASRYVTGVALPVSGGVPYGI